MYYSFVSKWQSATANVVLKLDVVSHTRLISNTYTNILKYNSYLEMLNGIINNNKNVFVKLYMLISHI